MASLRSLSDAQVLILAARFISDVDVASLQTLVTERRHILTDERIYRLLLTLYPNDETARAALLSLLRNIDSDFANVSSLDDGVNIDSSAVVNLSPDLAAQEAKRLLLPEIKNQAARSGADVFSSFIISWCHHIELTDGSLEDVLPLAKEFAPSHSVLREWADRYLLPAVRLQYQFYPGNVHVPKLYELEHLSGFAAIQALLSCAENQSSHADVARDLQEVVLPWIQGKAISERQGAWHDVNAWILSTSLKDFTLAAKALMEWSPPTVQSQLVSRYAQTGLAIMYASQASSGAHLEICGRILQRMAALTDAEVPKTDLETETATLAVRLQTAIETDLLFNSLLLESNVLTQVSRASVSFMACVLRTTEILLKYKISFTISEIALVCLNGSEERQKQEVRRILQQIPNLSSAMPAWEVVRQDLLWLYQWSSATVPGTSINAPTFLRKVSFQHIDEKLLDGILAQGDYTAVKKIYLEPESLPLTPSAVEGRVLSAIFFAYDNASNGNRTRGGVKRAHDLLLSFWPVFPDSEQFKDVDHLIKATHSLSFYSLTLQHGVPFQPVNIRAQKDPLSLIGKVLDQDARAYTKLDDLLEIGRNLILAHLQKNVDEGDEDTVEHKDNVNNAQHTITYLAVTSALAAHDFDTAYSYITTRLALSPGSPQSAVGHDDTSWRAAYAAGRYRPNNTPKSLHERIASLSKRMDLLSLALSLAPTAEPLSEVLGQWRRCEEEMDSLRSQALDEERAFEMRSNDVVPGGFGSDDQERDADETRQALAKRSMAGGSATYEEQAPMSLFDVASGAARALSRSTQGLRGGSLQNLKIGDSRSLEAHTGAIPPEDGEAGRVRKRDMVSNMVTSGLVSGVGWMLGAQPVSKDKEEHD